MLVSTFLPLLFVVVFYLAIFFVILYLIYTWVNKFIALRQEQNDLLREIIKRMDKN
jgi:p-aminobenzoyl-glutamate transporter AbgT